jgi:hypothetical protein
MFSIPPTAIAALLFMAVAIVAARRRDWTLVIDAAFVAAYTRWPSSPTLGAPVVVEQTPAPSTASAAAAAWLEMQDI